MTGSKEALDIQLKLLGGGYANGAALETDLADTTNLGGYKKMMNITREANLLLNDSVANAIMLDSASAFANLTASQITVAMRDTAQATIICANADNIAYLVNTTAVFDAVRNDTGAAYTNLKAQVNASGLKLKRATYTTSSSFTIHTGNTLKALSMAVIGGGGAGNQGTTSLGGTAGGGGELSMIHVPVASLPSSNTAYVVGAGAVYGTSAAATSNFGAFSTAAAGVDGSSGGTGGGSDANTSDTAIDTDVLNAAWQGNETESTLQGGDGGSASATGENGYGGTGGGIGGTNPTPNGGAGTAPGAGGGGGYQTTAYNGYPGDDAVTANYGAAGGGGGKSVSGTNDGGDGFQGAVVVYYVDSA